MPLKKPKLRLQPRYTAVDGVCIDDFFCNTEPVLLWHEFSGAQLCCNCPSLETISDADTPRGELLTRESDQNQTINRNQQAE
jgi:hypothetical protein